MLLTNSKQNNKGVNESNYLWTVRAQFEKRFCCYSVEENLLCTPRVP